jgi:predicted nucleic acid-binding protein
MTSSSDIDQIVQDILADMSLKEKAAIANLDEKDVPFLHYAFEVCVRGQIGQDDELSEDIMHRMWEVLQETHRVRCVK